MTTTATHLGSFMTFLTMRTFSMKIHFLQVSIYVNAQIANNWEARIKALESIMKSIEENTAKEGYGRSSRYDTQHQPHWEPDIELLGKKFISICCSFTSRVIGNASSSTGSAPRQMHPRQNVGRKRRRSSYNVYDI